MLNYLLLASAVALSYPPAQFQFESVHSIDDMRKIIEADFPIGTPRALLRQRFVDEGAGTQKLHPSQAGTEKYVYDINLCRYYVWRWNISADFDASEHLLQAYVNGEPVFAAGKQKKDEQALAKSGKPSIFRAVRPRPEATLGEKELVFLLLDADGDPATIDDQVLIGAGPTRADPLNMGSMHAYSNVEPWRSIFDADKAKRIVDYPGDCSKADQFYAQQRAASTSASK
jgi:hypothetical protein